MGLIAIQLDAGDEEGALARLDARSADSAKGSPLYHRLRGQTLARLGRDREAAAHLAQGQSAKPGGPDPWSKELRDYKIGESLLLLRSERLLHKGQVQAALQALKPLDRDEIDDVRVWRQLGMVYTRAGRHEDAARALDRACELSPDDARAWLSAAVAQRATGDTQRAEQSCAKALAIDPQLAEAALLRAQVLMGLKRLEDVIQMAERSQLQGPDQSSLECAAGKACLQQGELHTAMGHFIAALDQMPACLEALAGVALCQLQLGNLDKASEAIEQLANLNPEDPMLDPLREGLAEHRRTAGELPE